MTSRRWSPPDPATLGPEQRDLYDRIVSGPRGNGPFRLRELDGSLTGPFGLMLLAPEVGAALAGLGEAIRYRSGLTDRQREVAILTVAASRRSPFEWYAHEAVARGMGMTDEELQGLRSGTDDVMEDPVERTTHRVVRCVLAGENIGSDLFQEARASFGDRGLFELVTLVGYYETLAAMMQVFEVGVPDGEEDPFA